MATAPILTGQPVGPVMVDPRTDMQIAAAPWWQQQGITPSSDWDMSVINDPRRWQQFSGQGTQAGSLGTDSEALMIAQRDMPGAASYRYADINGITYVVGLDAQGNPIGPPVGTNPVDRGDFMRDALLVAGGGYALGSGLAAAGLTAAPTSAAVAGGAAGGTGVYGGALAGAGGAAGAAGGAAGGLASGGGAVAPAGSAAGAGGAAGGVAGGGAAGGLSTGQIGAQLGSSLIGQYLQGQAAQNAAGIQAGAAQQGQAQLQAALQAILQSVAPYTQAGTAALGQQGNLVGINGAEQQAAAIAALQASPQFQALQQQGENRILANASATGGLRGGNVQGALAQFSPALLADTINQQFSRLGAISGQGLSATGMGSQAQLGTAGAVASLLGQQGAAQAGGALAQGKTNAGYLGAITNAIGLYYGSRGGF